MISAVYLPIRWALDAKAGAALNIAHLASNELYFLVMSIAGAAVLKMMLSDATFSRTLVRCTRAEGILLAAADDLLLTGQVAGLFLGLLDDAFRFLLSEPGYHGFYILYRRVLSHQ